MGDTSIDRGALPSRMVSPEVVHTQLTGEASLVGEAVRVALSPKQIVTSCMAGRARLLAGMVTLIVAVLKLLQPSRTVTTTCTVVAEA